MKVKYYRYLLFFFLVATLFFLFVHFSTQSTRANSTSLTLRLPIQGTQRISSSRIGRIIVYDRLKHVSDFPNSKMDNVNGLYQTTLSLQNPNLSEFYAFFIKPSFTVGKIICANPNKATCNNAEIILNNNEMTIEDTTEPLFVGDLNDDGNINGADASVLFANLGKNDTVALSKADLNIDGSVDAQDYSLLLFSLGRHPVQPTPQWINLQITPSPTPLPTQTQQPTPTNQPPTATPQPSPTAVPTTAPTNTPIPQIGMCHAIKPDLAGGGAYDLKNGESSECTCTMGICAQAKCNSCRTGTCDCGSVPLQMPPINMDCSGGATFVIQICTK